jgi:putative oxidoreductase
MWNRFDKDLGLLIIRVTLGGLFMIYGWPKITGGVEKWEKLGGSMENLGITFLPVFWGFMAAFAEFGGGLLLILGFLFRPALLMLIFTMFVAALFHYMKGDGFDGYYSALQYLLLFVGLFVAGSGKYALKIGKLG